MYVMDVHKRTKTQKLGFVRKESEAFRKKVPTECVTVFTSFLTPLHIVWRQGQLLSRRHAWRFYCNSWSSFLPLVFFRLCHSTKKKKKTILNQ